MREGEGFAGGDAQTEGLLLGLVGVRGREREDGCNLFNLAKEASLCAVWSVTRASGVTSAQNSLDTQSRHMFAD